MLRKIRITAAAVFFTVITLLLLDFTGTLHAWFGWMAKIQFLPALLAVNVGVVAALVLLTLLFGRVYCSVICPLGVMQDVVSRAPPGGAEEPLPLLARADVAALRHAGRCSSRRLAAHVARVDLLAPYSAYGRIASNLLRPVYAWGNNLLAYLAERIGQLRVLLGRRLGEERRDAGRDGRDVRRAVRAGLAQRPHLLQYGLSGGHGAGTRRRASRCSSRVSTPRSATAASSAPATARRRASTRRRTGSITAVAWPAWTVSEMPPGSHLLFANPLRPETRAVEPRREGGRRGGGTRPMLRAAGSFRWSGHWPVRRSGRRRRRSTAGWP